MLDKVTRLLLVEDDEDDYILTCDYLDQLGSHTFDVEWLSCPEEAISELSENKHDICLFFNIKNVNYNNDVFRPDL